MLTYKLPNGDWNVRGLDIKQISPEYYGYMCRIREYERLGKEPYEMEEALYSVEEMKAKIEELEAENEELRRIIDAKRKVRDEP